MRLARPLVTSAGGVPGRRPAPFERVYMLWCLGRRGVEVFACRTQHLAAAVSGRERRAPAPPCGLVEPASPCRPLLDQPGQPPAHLPGVLLLVVEPLYALQRGRQHGLPV